MVAISKLVALIACSLVIMRINIINVNILFKLQYLVKRDVRVNDNIVTLRPPRPPTLSKPTLPIFTIEIPNIVPVLSISQGRPGQDSPPSSHGET